MIRAILRILVLFAICLVSAPSTPGAAPSTRVFTGSPTEPLPPYPGSKPIQEYQGLGVDRQFASFAGTVLDVNDRPLGQVLVQLFVDGGLAGDALTEPDGHYEIRVPYDSHNDTTVLLWYMPQDRILLPKEIVIRESKASQANGLISKCVPRATFTPGRQFRVYLFDSATRNKDIAELNCLP